ncbi:hypothetical protein JCM14036_25260 [Desulfotomaculum defluvii]
MPESSVAVQVTMVVPNGKMDPGGGVQEKEKPQLSNTKGFG